MGHTLRSVPEGDGTSGESLGPPSRPEDGAFVELPVLQPRYRFGFDLEA
jgi:hypothetical protein